MYFQSEVDDQRYSLPAHPELVEGRALCWVLAMDFYAYLLRCNDGSFYAGHTDNLEQRFAQHQSGFIIGYTMQRRPIELVWSQSFASREEAFAAERQIKGWSRAKKQALIDGDWSRLQMLARNRQRDGV